MKLAEVSANLSDPLLQQLHVSLSSSVFTVVLDAFLGSFIANVGRFCKPGNVLPPFEDAVNAARSEDEWKQFVVDSIGGVYDRSFGLRFGDWV
eukprot:scaffold120673_cov118-Phaeocystis_antarctica.AAC.4